MAYSKLGPFVDVAPGATPPAGAPKLNAAAINHIEDALAAGMSKGDLFVNVRDYGAKADGSTNDTPAIQAAADAIATAGRGVLFIPAGSYALRGGVHLGANTTVWAHGAKLTQTATDGGFLYANVRTADIATGYTGRGNITVLGGVWDNNAGITVVSEMANAFTFMNCANVTVRDVEIRNVPASHAIEFNCVNGGRAINCRFLGYLDTTSDASRAYAEAIQIDLALTGTDRMSRNILVDGCYCGPSDRLGTFGRFVGSHTSASGQYFDNITIVNNRIEGTNQEGVRGFGWRYVTVANNTFSGTGMSAIKLNMPDPATVGYTLTDCRQYTVTGNVIEACASEAGIRVQGYSTAQIKQVAITGNTVRGVPGGDGVYANNCAQPVVTGNRVESVDTGIFATNCTGPQITGNTSIATTSNAINTQGSTSATVTGNSVTGTSSNYGVYVDSPDAVVTGNNLRNVASAGVRLAAGATGAFVSGNRIRKGTGAATRGVYIDAAATGCTVVGNDIGGNGFTAANAVNVGAGAGTRTDYAGGTAVPGHNLI